MTTTSSFIQTIDNAVKATCFTKFKSYFSLTDQNTGMVFAPRSISQRKIAEKRGEGTVEFMSLWRTGIEFDWTRQRTPLARKGLQLVYNSGAHPTILTAYAVPAKMRYELRFWSRDLDKIMQATEAYLFWKHVYPNIVLDYVNLYEMDMYMKFDAVRDESDYDIYEKGQYFVSMMPIELEGWILSSLNAGGIILQIILDVYYREGNPPTQTDTLLDEITIVPS